MDYDRLVSILNSLFDIGTFWGDDAVRARAVEATIRELEKLLAIEWTRGEITAICGKELT